MLRQDHGNFNESSREGKCMVRAISSMVEARPKQGQGNVKTKSGQVHGKVKERSRRGLGKVKARSRQGREASSTTVIALMSIR